MKKPSNPKPKKPDPALAKLADPVLPAAPQGPEKQTVEITTTDPAKQHEVMKDTYVGTVGGNVFAVQVQPFVSRADGKPDSKAAQMFVAGLKESVRPRDAIEEMLVVQMAWAHARLARLSILACDQVRTDNVRVVNEACDRAANSFRRHVLALAEYRRPARTESFTVVKQANLAQQQVVNNAENQIIANGKTSNELGSSTAKALPAHAAGLEIAAPGGPEEQALDVEYRAENPGGESPRQQERHQAWQPHGGGDRILAGGGRDDATATR